MKADLHIHSSYSNDGELGIPDILQACLTNEIDLFSITDHNTVGGAREASVLSRSLRDLNFLPGIEIDCNYRGTDLHLLGYQVDVKSQDFDALQQSVRQRYLDAVPQMIRNLEQLGILLSPDEVMDKSGGEPPSAELLAEMLLQDPGKHENPKLQPYLPGGARSDMPLINFYLDYFAQGKPAYVHIEHLDYTEALALVRDNGGIPIVAHPGLNLKGREEVALELLDLGASGLEVFNNYHRNQQVDYFAGEIVKRRAWMTCGSDFHGHTKPRIRIGQYNDLLGFRDYLEDSLVAIAEQKEKKR